MRVPLQQTDYFLGPLSLSTAINFAGFLGFVVNNIAAIFFVTLAMDSAVDQMENAFNFGSDTYDFIIVGAGPSGTALANKLSEKHSVLLLEAGGVPSPFLYVPVMFFSNQNHYPYDWRHRTVPQQNASFGSNGNVTFWPAGRGLGGGSLINGMIFIRGFVQGYDKIAERTGNPLWKTKNVLKYYEKIEDYHGHFDDGSHGKGGGASIYKADVHPFLNYVNRAGAELGYPIADLNPPGPTTERFSPMDYHMKEGRRWDVYSGFITPILSRKTLTVKKYSTVIQVLLEGPNKRAIGVKYHKHGKELIARAKKEVILCAGGVQSPKILLHSGIGPKSSLDEVGIKQILDLPVGLRLQDKYGALLGPFVVSEGMSFLKNRDMTAKHWIDFVALGKGPYSTTLLEGTYTIRTPLAIKSGNPNPDIFTYVVAHSPDTAFDIDLKHSINMRQDILNKYHKTVENRDTFFQLVTLPKPKGYGILKLQDKDPHSPLYLDPKYLQNEEDVATLVEGVKFAVKLVEETKVMKEINASMLPIPYPGCEHHVFKSDAYYECWARHTTITAYKYCGTVPIGKSRETDPMAVVDPFLRVFGTEGLRVADTAVLQESEVSTNQASAQMLGLLAADWIKDYWANRSDEY